jgi:hypothetical protein
MLDGLGLYAIEASSAIDFGGRKETERKDAGERVGVKNKPSTTKISNYFLSKHLSHTPSPTMPSSMPSHPLVFWYHWGRCSFMRPCIFGHGIVYEGEVESVEPCTCALTHGHTRTGFHHFFPRTRTLYGTAYLAEPPCPSPNFSPIPRSLSRQNFQHSHNPVSAAASTALESS